MNNQIQNSNCEFLYTKKGVDIFYRLKTFQGTFPLELSLSGFQEPFKVPELSNLKDYQDIHLQIINIKNKYKLTLILSQ